MKSLTILASLVSCVIGRVLPTNPRSPIGPQVKQCECVSHPSKGVGGCFSALSLCSRMPFLLLRMPHKPLLTLWTWKDTRPALGALYGNPDLARKMNASTTKLARKNGVNPEKRRISTLALRCSPD